MVIILAYDGHIRNTENVGPNMFVTFTIVGFVEFPADLLTMITMEKLGRRHTTVWSLILSGVVCLIIAFVPPAYSLTVLVLEVIGRFLITMSINVAQQYPVEVLPTVARAQGSAAIHTMGYMSVFLSPYIIYLPPFLPRYNVVTFLNARIRKRLLLSPRQFSKATETTGRVFKAVCPFNKLKILPIYHQNYKNTLKKHEYLELEPLESSGGDGAKRFRIRALESINEQTIHSFLCTHFPRWLPNEPDKKYNFSHAQILSMDNNPRHYISSTDSGRGSACETSQI
ncbi:Solute carrier family 22 member 3 [Portunus trituberculatus]|uniref:Solute carrier family 22 member 3 n=1 Tax=Portunus trituberculatus TaxID=210409 RepID=A0A5B7CK27_PORTR|nr:Solute carrier family 22 member 3 [Portunus trituberculatus]